MTDSKGNFRAPLILGVSLLAAVLAADLLQLADSPDSTFRLVKSVVALAGVVSLGWGVFLWQKKSHYADERFLIHRLKASRAALIAGLVVLCTWLVADLVLNDRVQWQILLVLGTIAVTKLGAMSFYQKTD